MPPLTRRTFLKFLLGTALAEAVDVERLLWVPKPIITVPALKSSGLLSLEEINATTIKYIMPGIVESFFRDDPFFCALKRPGRMYAAA